MAKRARRWLAPGTSSRFRPTLTKFALEYVERHSPLWKPSTVEATNCYLRSAIPALARTIWQSSARFYACAKTKNRSASRRCASSC